MRVLSILVLPLLLAAASAPAAGEGAVTARLQVNAGSALLPAFLADCDVIIPEESTAADVLDGAVASGCIDSWEGQTFGFGVFVRCIDDLCAQNAENLVGTFWAFYVNGEASSVGVGEVQPRNGDVIGFTYSDWYTPFVL